MATDEKRKANVRTGCIVLVILLVAFVIWWNQLGETTVNESVSTAPGYVHKDSYGDDWAFTVDEGVIECRAGERVVFVAGSDVYAMNGLARGAMAQQGWKDINEIWKDNPAGSLTPKVDIGPFIDLGFDLCE